MVLIFLVILVVLLLCDSYIVFVVLNSGSWWIKSLILVPSVAYVAVIVFTLLMKDTKQGTLNLLFWLTLCVVIPTLIFALLSLIGKGVGMAFPSAGRIVDYLALLISFAWIGISLYGILFGWKKVSVDRITVSSSRIPESFNGYRIVQLSDFHIGTYASAPGCVDRIVDKVNSLKPDLIVFTGDLVNTSSSEIEEFTEVLSRLRAKDGVYSVLGNHDFCLYRRYSGEDTPAKQLENVVRHEKEIGWKLLRNESVQIVCGNDSIALIGVDNAGSRGFIDRSELKKATKGLPEDEFKILLSHDPSHWRREVLPNSDIDLMLAGHTHAMQFKLFGWSPSAWTYPEWGGLYAEGNRNLYVSTGIGENIAFRFGAWPQIVLMTLHHK
ncbi:MAG: metallophosphoesterase [Muribaculaceae bacterium]|nr:metallophosphoesterase [Muribaculaceae bacterium]